jgi:glycosyltransferase involved in cell wall biosynthesis
MNNKAMVSSIIIFFNGEKFIGAAIESIFAQNYENWELLLVDDGSTDGSTAIAQAYAADYPDRVRYLEHPDHQNRGMSAARNLGIKHARGDYIAFLDADDIWLPHKLAEQVSMIDAHPEAAMIYGRTQIWYSWTGRVEDAQRDCMLDLGVTPDTLVQPPTLLLLLLENKVQTPTTCNALVRREVFERYGGFQDAFRGMFEDQAFFTKVCLNAPVFVANACWARYRQHPESCCAVAERTGTDYMARLPLLRWMNDYFTIQAVSDRRVWKALYRELWPYQHPTLHRLRGKMQVWVWQLEYYGKLLAGRI